MLVKYLMMTFITQGGDKVTLSLNGIREDLTGEEIEAVMDVIIAKNAFITKGGDLKGKYSAQIISKDVDEFDVA